jgi:hypothetical protein
MISPSVCWPITWVRFLTRTWISLTEDRASWYILIIKQTSCTISQIYLIKYFTYNVFYSLATMYIYTSNFIHLKISAWQMPIACIQCWDTADDGQWTSPKHVEYFIKLIWEIVHLVGFRYANNRWSRNMSLSVGTALFVKIRIIFHVLPVYWTGISGASCDGSWTEPQGFHSNLGLSCLFTHIIAVQPT